MPYYIGLSNLSNIRRCGNYAGRRKAERHKLLSAEARRILSLLKNKPFAEENMAREENGRPFFIENGGREWGIDFSISHSGTLAAVSLVRGKNLRTACDLELVRQRAGMKEIAEQFFSVSERDYIFSKDLLSGIRFYEIWTLKECYLKLLGQTVFDMALVPSFINDNGQKQGHFNFCGVVSSPLVFSLFELSGGAGESYILATAIAGTEEEQPEFHWFSPAAADEAPAPGVSLPFRSIAKIKAALKPDETVRPKM